MGLRNQYDAVVIGSGPNGLAAAIVVVRAGRSVLVIEAEEQIGGAARSGALTLPGFTHDLGSAVHPMAVASPFFRTLPLHEHGLEWIDPPYALAHPFDDGSAAVVERSLEKTCRALAGDGDRYQSLVGRVAEKWSLIDDDILARSPFRATPSHSGGLGWRPCSQRVTWLNPRLGQNRPERCSPA